MITPLHGGPNSTKRSIRKRILVMQCNYVIITLHILRKEYYVLF